MGAMITTSNVKFRTELQRFVLPDLQVHLFLVKLPATLLLLLRILLQWHCSPAKLKGTSENFPIIPLVVLNNSDSCFGFLWVDLTVDPPQTMHRLLHCVVHSTHGLSHDSSHSVT